MANYAKIRRDAVQRRQVLQDDLASAKRSVAASEKEIAVLDQIISALKGVDGRMKRGRVGRPPKAGGRRRKGGKWRKGHPGRPPKWYVDQQAALGKKAKKRGRRKGARRRRRAAAAAAPAPSPMSGAEGQA